MRTLSSTILRQLLLATIIVIMGACSATRYVPLGDYLLRSNHLEIVDTLSVNDKQSQELLDADIIESYIQQRPNRRLLGIGASLGFYNMVDTTKHSIWHRFWSSTMGTAPVIYDSVQTSESVEQISLYLSSNGFFNAQVSDTVEVSEKRKAKVTYFVNPGAPYTVNKVEYNIADKFLERIVLQDSLSCLIRTGDNFATATLEQERNRIAAGLQNEGFWGFGVSYISFEADSTIGDNKVDVSIKIRQFVERIDAQGKPVLINHPIYRISTITLNSLYDPTLDMEAKMEDYDTLRQNGIDILYEGQPYIRPKVLVNSLRLSPYELFDQSSVTRTRDNLRNLGYSANVLFTSKENASDGGDVVVTLSDDVADEATNQIISTTERLLDCRVLCTPNVRQNFNTELELSTTANYFSGALTFGYQNLNLFNGGEVFSVDVRGAYELMKNQTTNNAFELSGSVSLEAPRFWLPINNDKESLFRGASSKITFSYSTQERPYYHRDLVSAVFGYSWTLPKGGRISINPVDINLVKVPWVSEEYLESIENPYLANSYESQIIAGLSTSYYYTTNSDINYDSFTFGVTADINGNLLRGLTSLWSSPVESDQESYYQLFGLRFSQYVRSSLIASGRSNVSDQTQIAWRMLFAGGYAYGNSTILPFERLLYAGGANSMRGWQLRTLGPGSVFIDDLGDYPSQLGDLHLEANIEVRQKLIYGLSGAVFFDAGNIWMNSSSETRSSARFNFNRFYKEIAFNTGLGVRYDIAGMMVLRLDWGLKLHNPNNVQGERWLHDLGFADTSFHFAIGLPF
ncbi:MAG: BamA/TamA family outer membrane protein [Rikenellaceae bacterium]